MKTLKKLIREYKDCSVDLVLAGSKPKEEIPIIIKAYNEARKKLFKYLKEVENGIHNLTSVK